MDWILLRVAQAFPICLLHDCSLYSPRGDLTADPFCQAVCGWDQQILADNFRSRTENGINDGWVYVVGVEEGAIDGVLFFNPPGYDFGYSYVLLALTVSNSSWRARQLATHSSPRF